MSNVETQEKPAGPQAPAAGPNAQNAPSPGYLAGLRSMPGYGWYALLLFFGYGAVEIFALGFAPGDRIQVPGSVRQSPGGYRSYHFWHSGLHGGK